MVPDRLGVAWEAFRTLSARDRHEFLAMLREWHLARRIDALAARGRTYSHGPPQSLAGVSVGEALDRDADDLKKISIRLWLAPWGAFTATVAVLVVLAWLAWRGAAASMDVDMDSEVLESAAYGALRNSIRRLLKFIAVEVESQGGGVITIYNDQLEIVGSRRVHLPGLNELAFLGFIEIARLPKRNLISLSDRWRAVAATKRAKTLAGSGLLWLWRLRQ